VRSANVRCALVHVHLALCSLFCVMCCALGNPHRALQCVLCSGRFLLETLKVENVDEIELARKNSAGDWSYYRWPVRAVNGALRGRACRSGSPSRQTGIRSLAQGKYL